MKRNRIRSYWYLGRFLIFFSIPIIVLLLPYSIFEESTTICLFNNLFGVDCPGCGTTRAIHQVIHLNLASAFDLNRMIVVVFPLLTYLWIKYVLYYFREAKDSFRYILVGKRYLNRRNIGFTKKEKFEIEIIVNY